MQTTSPPYPNRRSLRGRFLRRVTAPEASLAEWWSAGVGVVWGLWLANPWVDAFGSLPVYQEMSKLAPDWAWGITVAAGGIFQLHSLWNGVYGWRRAASFGGCVTWLFVGLCMFASAPTSTGPPVYISLGALQAVIYLRLKVEAIKAAQELARRGRA